MRAHFVLLARSFSHLIAHLKRTPKLFNGFTSTTYSDAVHKKKSTISVIGDYFYLFFILGIMPRNYKLWQFDVKNRSEFSAYLDEPDSPLLRRRLYSTLWDDSYGILVNDKHVFHCICKYHRIPTPQLFGSIRDGHFSPSQQSDVDKADSQKLIVIKPARGTQGKGIHFMTHEIVFSMLNTDGNSVFSHHNNLFSKGEFIVEEYIDQHNEMKKINPYSVNTIRVITFITRKSEVIPLSAMLRTSASEAGTDNFSTGGIVVGIDLETGKLKSRGFFKPGYGTTVDHHPLTQLKFADFAVPYWPEIIKLLQSAQKAFYHLNCVGWDVAVGQSGPIIVEANIEWGTAGIQAVNGGLLTKKNREYFEQYGLYFRGLLEIFSFL